MAGEVCPDQPQGFRKVKTTARRFRWKEIFFLLLFKKRFYYSAAGTPKACVQKKFFANIQRIDCVHVQDQLLSTSYRYYRVRGAIANRTSGSHKNLYISLFLLTIFCPIYYIPRNRTRFCTETK